MDIDDSDLAFDESLGENEGLESMQERVFSEKGFNHQNSPSPLKRSCMARNPEREWDFCDQCWFYVSCLRIERRKGIGCDVFEPYPYELPNLEAKR